LAEYKKIQTKRLMNNKIGQAGVSW